MKEAAADVFRSTDYRGNVPWSLLVVREGLRPLSIAMLPLMIITLVLALTTGDLLRLVLWGYPAVAILSMAWTVFHLDRRVAEIRFFEMGVMIRSMTDCSRGRPGRRLPLFDVRDYGSWMVIAAGDLDVMIDRARWPDYRLINEAAHRALAERAPTS